MQRHCHWALRPNSENENAIVFDRLGCDLCLCLKWKFTAALISDSKKKSEPESGLKPRTSRSLAWRSTNWTIPEVRGLNPGSDLISSLGIWYCNFHKAQIMFLSPQDFTSLTCKRYQNKIHDLSPGLVDYDN